MSTAAERNIFISGAKHCDSWGFTSFSLAGDGELSLQACPSPGTCCRQAKNQGLQAPKGKKGEPGQGIKPKNQAATVSRHHLSEAVGRASCCEWDRAGQQVSNRRGQRAGEIQEMWLRGQHTHTKITSIFCAHILCINAWKVVCNWKERKLHLSSLRTTMSATLNYISVLVNNPPWWISYLWTIGMFLCDANDLDPSYECEWFISFFVCKKSSSKPLHTFPLGRPNSLSAWKITFSVLPDAKVLVMLKQKRVGGKKGEMLVTS